MTLTRLSSDSVSVSAKGPPHRAHAWLALASVGLLPPLCALALALLPAPLRSALAALSCGGAVLLCGPVLLGRLLDAPPSKQGGRPRLGRRSDASEERP